MQLLRLGLGLDIKHKKTTKEHQIQPLCTLLFAHKNVAFAVLLLLYIVSFSVSKKTITRLLKTLLSF